MTLKRITVRNEKASRFFLWLAGLSLIPCFLLSGYYNLYWLPSRTYNAAEQEVVDAIVELTKQYPEIDKITVDFIQFPEILSVQAGTASLSSQSLFNRCIDTVVVGILLFILAVFVICILWCISKIFIRYED